MFSPKPKADASKIRVYYCPIECEWRVLIQLNFRHQETLGQRICNISYKYNVIYIYNAIGEEVIFFPSQFNAYEYEYGVRTS